MSIDLIFTIGKKVLSGGEISYDEALALTQVAADDVPMLLGVANKVRAVFTNDEVETCEIISGRSGGCAEDCKFCAQSGRHPLLPEERIVAAAKQAEADGACRFGIATSGRGMEDDPDFPRLVHTIKRIGEETSLNRCCSLGTLGEAEVAALKEAGLSRYHHNLETARSFFPHICTTHTYDERLATIKRVKAAGLQVCCGGIIGMGENWAQRLELAFTLKELDVDSVPVNVLNAIPGTALEGQKRLPPLEILQAIAIFRLILPAKIIRYAGGKEPNLGELVPLGYLSGINGVLIGNYLTTAGRGADQDLATIAAVGLRPLAANG